MVYRRAASATGLPYSGTSARGYLPYFLQVRELLPKDVTDSIHVVLETRHILRAISTCSVLSNRQSYDAGDSDFAAGPSQ